MIDVEIRNFQSIEHTHVQIDGFTAIIGRSNLGKSAVIRALKAALTGAPEDNYIRHKTTCERAVKNQKSCKCSCSVHMKSEGFDLLWTKGGDEEGYVFNGEKYTAVGKGTPEFLEAMFGLVKIGDDRILLQVADQFKSEGGGPIFLLDAGGSVVADVLSDVAQLDRINVAMKLAEKDRREASSQRKVREKDVLELKIRLTGYDGLDAVLGRVRQVETEENLVAQKRIKRDQIAAFKETIWTIARQVKALTEVPKIVIPEATPLVQYQKTSEGLAGYLTDTTSRQKVISSLQGIEMVVAPSFGSIQDRSQVFVKLQAWLTKLRTHKDVFARWKTVEAVPTPPVDGALKADGSAKTLGALRNRLWASQEQVDNLEKLVAGVEIEFQTVETEKVALGGVCPTCDQPMNLDHEHAAE